MLGRAFRQTGRRIPPATRVVGVVAVLLSIFANIPTAAQSLTNALDTTNLVWATAGNAGWFSQTAFSYDGADAARSGAIGDTGETYIFTTVTGPGTVSFWWRVSSQPTADFLQFWIGTNRLNQISGATDWHYQEFPVPAGSQTLKWRYVKDMNLIGDMDAGFVDRVIYSPVPKISAQQAAGVCGAAWVSGGNNNPTFWSGQTNVTHDGAIAVQSGAIYHSQQSWLQATVVGATNVSFWWKVSSEPVYDFLDFYIGTNEIANISGEVNWEQKQFSLPAGTNILTWHYNKDASETVGQDAAWLDQVVFSPPLRALPYGFTDLKRLTDGRFQFSVTGEVDCACSVLYSTNLTNWSVFSNFTTTASSRPMVDHAASNSVMRFYRALSP